MGVGKGRGDRRQKTEDGRRTDDGKQYAVGSKQETTVGSYSRQKPAVLEECYT